MKTPLAVSVKMVFLNAVLNVLSVVFLPVEWRHVGLAGSTVICAAGSCVMLAFAARRANGGIGLVALAKPVGKTVVASLVMGAALASARSAWISFSAGRGWTGTGVNVASLAGLIVLGGIVFFTAAFTMNGRAFLGRLKSLRRRGRRK